MIHAELMNYSFSVKGKKENTENLIVSQMTEEHVSANNLIERMQRIAPDWMMGCTLRSCWFEPTFHKYAGQLCEGVQIHVDDPSGYDHLQFRPWRLMCLVFKALKSLNAGYPMWRDFEYEYERDRHMHKKGLANDS